MQEPILDILVEDPAKHGCAAESGYEDSLYRCKQYGRRNSWTGCN